MNINEIFESFQGEGPSIGNPSIFVRLSGCNLRCVYCDTKYTWLFSKKTLLQIQESIPDLLLDQLGDKIYSKTDETHKMEIAELVTKINCFQAKNIVITGGEPLLQKKEIIQLLNHPNLIEYKFEIETNGTIPPIDRSMLLREVALKYNVSPKLSNSFNYYEDRIKPTVLEELNSENSIFKFVISKNDDLKEVKEILKAIRISPLRVYLMPEATNQSDLLIRGKNVAELALAQGYNYSHRLHVEFYGDKRGV